MRAVLPVARGPGSLEAAISCLVRVFEEFPIDSLSVIYDGAESEARSVAKMFSEVFRLECEQVKLESGSDPGLATEILNRVLAPHGASGVVSIISSAGRRVAASLALATLMLKNTIKQNDVRIDIVHIHFYWGEWGGLFYPYTPRRLEPMISMLSEGRFFSVKLRKTANLFSDLEDENQKLPISPATPLRRCIAEFTRRINEFDDTPYRTPTKEAETRTMVSVDIKLRGKEIRLDFNLYEPKEIVSSLSKLSKAFEDEQGIKEILV